MKEKPDQPLAEVCILL